VRPPLTVIAVVAVIVATLAYLAVHAVDAWLVGGGALLLLASFALVRGVWIAWLFLTAVAIGDIVDALVTWPAWGELLVNGALAVLLLAPPTRDYVRRRP
jgi:hypothetical protein